MWQKMHDCMEEILMKLFRFSTRCGLVENLVKILAVQVCFTQITTTFMQFVTPSMNIKLNNTMYSRSSLHGMQNTHRTKDRRRLTLFDSTITVSVQTVSRFKYIWAVMGQSTIGSNHYISTNLRPRPRGSRPLNSINMNIYWVQCSRPRCKTEVEPQNPIQLD